jgi:hemerythrin-like domain-containing protein
VNPLTSEDPVSITQIPPASVNPIATWHTEHMYFRRLLDLLNRQLDVFESGARPNYELMLDIITYLREYSDRYHHPREDVAFARLEAHCPQLGLTLARLRQEHRVIATAGETLAKLLTAILDDNLMPRSAVESAAATYLVYYTNHIGREESDVLTHAARTLTAEDWEAVRTAVPLADDPLFGESPAKHYRDLRRHIALES